MVAAKPILSPTEELAFSTIRIKVNLASGGQATGTGFFFTFGSNIPVIVTNKHVVKGAISGGFNLTLADADGKPLNSHQELIVPDFERMWIKHPDPAIDLAIMPVAPLLKQARDKGVRFFFIPFAKDLLATSAELEELSPAEALLMVGYPNGIWDEVNNFPVFRRGIAATHPGRLYNGRSEFVIDVACFPGSSGSPVLLHRSGVWMDKLGNSMMGGTEIKLLGVLYSGPTLLQTGKIKTIPIPTKVVPVAEMKVMLNLGFVIRAEKLLDFESILSNVRIVPAT